MEYTTITWNEVEFEVEYDYQPEEAPERGPEAQYPGCAEEIQGISEFKHNGTCFLEFIDYDIEAIEDLILESRKN